MVHGACVPPWAHCHPSTLKCSPTQKLPGLITWVWLVKSLTIDDWSPSPAPFLSLEIFLVTILMLFIPLPMSHLFNLQKTFSASAEFKGFRGSVPGTRDKDQICFYYVIVSIILMRSDEKIHDCLDHGRLCVSMCVGRLEQGRWQGPVCRTAGVHPFFSGCAEHWLCAGVVPEAGSALWPDGTCSASNLFMATVSLEALLCF